MAYHPKYLLLAALLGSCSSSQFGGGGKKAETQKADSPAQDSELGTTGAGLDPEDDKADQPALVSGAFLTCSEDPSLPSSDAARIGVGCAVMVSGSKLAASAFPDRQWALLNLFNLEATTTFQDAAEPSPWHVTTTAPRLGLATYRVRLTVTTASEHSVLYARITPKAAGSGSEASSDPAAPATKAFGDTQDFQLGDGDWSASLNQGCVRKLQQIGLTGPGLAVTITVKSDTAKVAASLSEMCGVSYGDVNYVALSSDASTVYKGFLAKGATDFAVPGQDLAKGTYKLFVVSPYAPQYQNRDDFVVGRITFTTSGDVDVGQPVVVRDPGL